MKPTRYTMLFGCLLLLAALSACTMVDEDRSDCDDEVKVDYDMQLVTNINIELNKKLPMATDSALHVALREYLSDIFSDYAHDVSLSFFDTQGDSTLLHSEERVMDANERSFSLNLPRHQYMHLALANMAGNDVVGYEGNYYCRTARLWQSRGDSINPHKTGIFTARQPMDILEGQNQSFKVHLYMANCAAALVLDPKGTDVSKISVVSTGFASRFDIADSTYFFATYSPIVRADRIEAKGTSALCYCTVNFPSKDPKAASRTEIQSDDAIVGKSDEALWEFRVYVTNPDGKITESILSVKEQLPAGYLKIIRAGLDDGKVETEDQTVGVSVTLDWTPGINQEIPL